MIICKLHGQAIDETSCAGYHDRKKGAIFMKENIAKTLSRAKWGSIALIVFGLVLVCFPDFGSRTVAAVIAWGLMIAGTAGLVIGVLSWPAFGFGTLGGSGISLLVGLYIMRNPLSLASILGVLLGALLTVQGLGALADALRLRRNGAIWGFSLVWACVTLIMGLILIFSPLTTSRIVMSITGLIMMVCGGGNLYTHAKATPYIRTAQGKSRIIDADE